MLAASFVVMQVVMYLDTYERANIRNPEARKRADGIIATQKREIGEMKTMLKRLKGQ